MLQLSSDSGTMANMLHRAPTGLSFGAKALRPNSPKKGILWPWLERREA